MRTAPPSKGLARAFVLGLIALSLVPVGAQRPRDAASQAPPASLNVIVREVAPLTSHAERAVRRFGGTIRRQLPIVGGFAATLPAASVDRLAAERAIAGVWRDGTVVMHDDDDDDDDDIRSYDKLPPNEVWRQAIRLPDVQPGVDGEGVTVAVLDTGIVPSPDLAGRVAARADLTPDRDGSDRYGHGTHMAGVVAGDGAASSGRWRGVAPGAEIVAVKVAGWDGATDVSAVLAGLQWVVTHKARYGIRVLNLSFGTDSYQSYLRDPLDYAVERVWQAGILVVVAAGNRGSGDGTISKPGDDPFVLTVGAADLNGTVDRADDVVAGFSSRGPTQDNLSKPDLVAPGVTIVSSRAPNSTIDAFRPLARIDEHYFKGTGSSQAAAVVSGLAALMFEADPSLTPDVAKAVLVGTTDRTLAGQKGAGQGLVDKTARPPGEADAKVLGSAVGVERQRAGGTQRMVAAHHRDVLAAVQRLQQHRRLVALGVQGRADVGEEAERDIGDLAVLVRALDVLHASPVGDHRHLRARSFYERAGIQTRRFGDKSPDFSGRRAGNRNDDLALCRV